MKWFSIGLMVEKAALSTISASWHWVAMPINSASVSLLASTFA
ncbi:MAG: hypothetical protein NTU70_07150 [Methylococcales bacterium]|nr:hypothetical protein [Methylococcales bacterium]